MPTTYTSTEVAEIVGAEAIEQVNEWLARGDGIAVYVNADLGSHEVGHHRMASFGSPRAQFVVPPDQLPDFPGEINWRYRLEGVYRGRELTSPAEHDWASPTTVLELITASFRSPIKGRPDRLVGYGIEVRKYAEASIVTITLDVTRRPEVGPQQGQGEYQMAGRVLTPLIGGARITVSTLTNERGEVDRLGWFHWLIEGDTPLQGDDSNLGSTIVNVHNLSMDRD
jgi:hypothetical protein